MPASLIFEHPSGGKLWQGGIDDVPSLPGHSFTYDHVYYMAAEQPPLDSSGIWAPMVDVECPTAYKEQAAAAKAAARRIVREVAQGLSVLVTCQMGINRSSTATGLALKALGVADPVALIRAKRPRTLTNRQLEALVRRESI